MTLYYRVVDHPTMNYKIFVHFDPAAQIRIIGDHEPIAGRCGTTYWQAGDYIIDTFDVEAGGVTHPKGTYSIWTGFFTGSNGQWKNMVVRSGNADRDNRVSLGSIRID